jgi:putative DNA primase/helicase
MHGGSIAMPSEPALTEDEIRELTEGLNQSSNNGNGADNSSTEMPFGFQLRETGLWLIGEEERPDVWVCSPLEVLGQTRDRHNESWGRLLQWRDADGRLHTWAMPATVLAGDGSELRARLLDGGLSIAPNRKAREALTRYISESRPEERVRCTRQVGWHGQSFILPDMTIGSEQEEVIYQGDGESLLRQSAALGEWKEAIGKYCEGNSRLIFPVCVALAGPLLFLCDEQAGGFHFVGSSSTGKTTVLDVAGSVLGGGGKAGFLQSWRATSNGLESVAEAHNDLTLILDEISQCDGRESGEVAYMLANGQGKSRSRAAGGLRRKSTWRLLFLSAGEISLTDHIAAVGRRAKGGQEVRLINIPADAGSGLGLFEKLHGFPSADAFARYLQDSAKRVYGVAIRHFIEFVTTRRDRVQNDLQSFRKAFISMHVPEAASSEVSRAAGRFSIVAAAGELAIEAGILPWKEDTAVEMAGRLFAEWLSTRGTSGAMDIEAAIQQVRPFLEQHGSARFERENESRPIVARAGFYRRNGESNEFWIMRETFRSEVCRGFDSRVVARALAERGYLVYGDGNRPLSRRRVGPDSDADPDNRVSVYVIREGILR